MHWCIDSYTSILSRNRSRTVAARLVYGLVQLALLAFGILAAGTVVGVESRSYEPRAASATLPWRVALLGVLVFAVGNYLHFSAPVSTFGWVLLALVVAYGRRHDLTLVPPVLDVQGGATVGIQCC